MSDDIKTKWGNIPVVIDPSMGPDEFKLVPTIKPVVKVYRAQLPTDAQIKQAISEAIDKLFGR
jgi:hypothetical protein